MVAGCELRPQGARWLGAGVPETLIPSDTEDIEPAFHLLSRAAWGPWPGDVEHVRSVGPDAWIASQLRPDKLDDSACLAMSRRFESVVAPVGEAWEYRQAVLTEELARHTFLRALTSKRQLQEVMVGFWSDHFNIQMAKGDCVYAKPSDDREVIRRHALGSFRDLLRASALSPAMLVYLDGVENKRGVPNENYARELLELHTLGVDGGYSQADVMEAARCLTGWRVRGLEEWRRGRVEFHPDRHDDGVKMVLGSVIAGRGAAEIDDLIDVVAAHPSTARFLATKLCRWFIADDPPAAAIAVVADTFTTSEGDVPATLRAVFSTPEFWASAGGKLKRPFRFVVSSMRGLGGLTDGGPEVLDWLGRMGQAPFQHPTPDGYPFEARPWLGTLLWRWSFARQIDDLAHIPWQDFDLDAHGLFRHLVGRRGTASERAVLVGDLAAVAPLILSSPAFQRH